MLHRIVNLIRGFIGLIVGKAERQNPEALLELEKENLRKQIGNYNQGLAAHAGLCERLVGQVRNLEAEEADLKAKTTAHLRAGNREVAGQYALRLQTVSREIDENRKQLEQAEAAYRELVQARDVAVKAAKDKIEAMSSAVSDLKVKRATAELAEMASGMIGAIGGVGENSDRLKQLLDEEKAKAAGRIRVARDSMGAEGIALKETEQQALAEQALEDFAAKEGIMLDPKIIPPTENPEPPKRLQP
ncbi:MAG: PspA/IM30 family protein [Chthoniobacteraceae bacterium]